MGVVDQNLLLSRERRGETAIPDGTKGKSKGFTLIELLIVVAIIAILAAIAVPNFLEAQVRAKISRAKADMRTIAVAVEAYAVDHNRPPIGMWEGQKSDPSNLGYPTIFVMREWVWSTLTTPVAYVSTMLYDPFGEKGFIDDNGVQLRDRRWAFFQYQTGFLKGLGGGGSVPTWHWREAKTLYGLTWYTYTRGPSRQDFGKKNCIAAASGNPTDGDYPNLLYDATNGTVSKGIVYRSNKNGN